MTKRIVVLTSLVFACFASLGLFAETVETNDAENAFCDLMMQTTNSWGRDVEVFRAAANAGMRTLSNIPGKAGEPHRLLWLTTVVRLQSPTNTCDEYLTWQDEKGKWLFGLGHKYRSSSCSNLWLAVADELRCQRIAIPTEESIRNRYRDAGSQPAYGAVSVWSGLPDAYYEEMRWRTARLDAASTLASLLVNCYGCQVLPLLPMGERMPIYSNLVERAGLSESEAERIRQRLLSADMN